MPAQTIICISCAMKDGGSTIGEGMNVGTI